MEFYKRRIMGYYINPKDETKEQFLIREGKPILPQEGIAISKDGVPVCLVQNNGFTAAGIAYDRQELEAFQYPGDQRPKLWFSVPLESLRPYFGDYDWFKAIENG